MDTKPLILSYETAFEIPSFSNTLHALYVTASKHTKLEL